MGITGGVLVALGAGVMVFKDELTRIVAQRKFESVPGMTCQIESAHLDLASRTISLQGFHFNFEEKGVFEDYFYADEFELIAQGPMLAGKSTKSHMIFTGVEVHVRKDADPSKAQYLLEEDAKQAISELSRWDADVIRVHEGTIRYIDSSGPLDLVVEDFEAEVTNIAAARDAAQRERLTFSLSGEAENSAKIRLEGESQLGVDKPDFNLDGRIVGFPLEAIDPLIHERIGVSVDDGYIGLSAHLKGRGGHLEGYLAPRFQRLKFSAELEDDLRKSLVAWGLPIVGRVVEDPIAPKPGNNIQVKGQYGAHTPFSLEATKKRNSWLQDKVLKVRGRGEDS